MTEAQQAVDLLVRLLKPGHVPSTTEDEQIQRCSLICCTYFRNRMHIFLRAHSDRPVAVTYQADCTPSSTQETIVCKVGSKKVVRTGARTAEFLLHRVFARSADNRQAVLFGPPDLLADKTTSTHVRAARRYLCYPFAHGCRTINITHLVFDGAIFEPLTSQLHSDFCIAVNRGSTAVDADPTLMKLCCWFVRTPCILHGVHNAMKWGMQHELGDK